MNWREALICLFLLGASILLWQALKEEDTPAPIDDVQVQELPGFYLQSTELVRYNKDGKALYTINADHIEQDPVSQELSLSKLSIVYGEKSEWKIDADAATLPSDRSRILFSGNVIAKQLNSKENVSFKSNTLNYDVNAQRLSTKDRVTTRKGLRSISATGMTLDMPNERVQLHSKVKIRIANP